MKKRISLRKKLFVFLPLLCHFMAASENPEARPEAIIESGNARFTILTPEMIRIEYSDKGVFEDRATFTIQNRNFATVPSFSRTEDNEYLYLSTDKLNLKYRKGSNPKTLPASPDNLSITMSLNGHDVMWYPGKPDPLNLKGTCRTLDSSNGDNKRAELENGLISRSGWSVIDDSWTAARPDGSRSFALENDRNLGYSWWSERKDPHALDLYFFGYGHDYKKALADFTKVAGKIPLPPAYVFGYWYSKYASYSADDYRQIMTDLADNDIPADVMILDMDWHWNGDAASGSAGIGGWTGWSWNTNLIPEPQKLLQEIHNKNFRIALNLHPADGINSHESPSYYNAMKNDLGGKYDENGNIAWNLDFPDFTKSFFSNIIRDHEAEGVDFWWLDWQQHLTSPYTSGLGQTFWCNHVFYNDMKHNRPNRRPVIFHRWGGLGSHRYQIGFSGDALINFPTLAFQPYFTATASNVGYTYWGHDLGGHAFTDEKTVNDPELVLRWIQFGVFTPIFRTHATKDERIERRIWKFSNFPDMLKAVKLRYALFPYIYTAARETFDTGTGICRPLYYEYPETEEAYRFENEYFFGNDILVAPITEAARDGKTSMKEIWFPKGIWWSASTNEIIEGPCTATLEFKADEIPYFYRQGSIVPLCPSSVKNVTAPLTSLILNIVAGNNGSGLLYEDKGDNNDYATAFATTIFRQKADGNTSSYIIEPRNGDSAGLVDSRSWQLNIHNATIPEKILINGDEADNGAWSYDRENHNLKIEIPTTGCDQRIEVNVTYSNESGGVTATSQDRMRVGYNTDSDTLTADLGCNREHVSLSIFNLAGVECVSKSYSGISCLTENFSKLSPSIYICRIKADNDLSINKICK